MPNYSEEQQKSLDKGLVDHVKGVTDMVHLYREAGADQEKFETLQQSFKQAFKTADTAQEQGIKLNPVFNQLKDDVAKLDSSPQSLMDFSVKFRSKL